LVKAGCHLSSLSEYISGDTPMQISVTSHITAFFGPGALENKYESRVKAGQVDKGSHLTG